MKTSTTSDYSIFTVNKPVCQKRVKDIIVSLIKTKLTTCVPLVNKKIKTSSSQYRFDKTLLKRRLIEDVIFEMYN